MTKEFMMLEKQTRHGTASTNKHQDPHSFQGEGFFCDAQFEIGLHT